MRKIIALLLLLPLTAVTACGGGESDEDQITAAVSQLSAAKEKDELEVACKELLTSRFVKVVYGGDIQKCIDQPLNDPDESEDPGTTEVESVKVNGDAATVSVTTVGGKTEGTEGTWDFRKDAGDLPAFDGPLGRAKTAVERAKRMLQFAVASALEVTGQKLIENQEASARAADMAMEIYTMESAVVRADKLAASGDRWADFARDCAEVFANEGAPKVAAHARLFLAEVLEGEALDAALAALDAIALPAPVAGSVRRGRIADLLIEKGAYPIDLF